MKDPRIAGGFMTVVEAAEFLNVSRATVYRLMEQGVIPFKLFGNCRRIPRAHLEQYAADGLPMPIAATPTPAGE